MAGIFAGKPRGFTGRDHAGQDLRGEDPLNPNRPDTVELRLSQREASILHAALEDLLESGAGMPELERAYRLLGWRLLAAKGGTGLTGRLASIAREAESLEGFEAARDEELGPIIQRLESPENRDP